MSKQHRHNNLNEKNHRIMIIAGEASGDLHGGALAEALFSKNPSVYIVGFGGEKMREAGVDIRFDIKKLGIVGIIEVFFHFPVILEAYRRAVKILENQIQLLVLIDFSGFNLRVAKAAHRLGIPVVYYVSPQVWAWRSGRIKTIARYVDLMLVILPFEKEIYDKANVPCEFVGHPLLDEYKRRGTSISEAVPRKNVERSPTIALLPGSRLREVTSLLPLMLAGLEALQETFPWLQVKIPVASSLPKQLIPDIISSSSLAITLTNGTVYDVLHQSDLAVVASGTATLQSALSGTAMVVIYKVSWISYTLARLLAHVKYACIVNIIANERFVPELIQGSCSAENIAKELKHLLRNETEHKKMQEKLLKVAQKLGAPGASSRAASAILRLLDKTDQNKNPLLEQGSVMNQVMS